MDWNDPSPVCPTDRQEGGARIRRRDRFIDALENFIGAATEKDVHYEVLNSARNRLRNALTEVLR
jgi:hypothetical protein